jgi:hypothetical protein
VAVAVAVVKQILVVLEARMVVQWVHLAVVLQVNSQHPQVMVHQTLAVVVVVLLLVLWEVRVVLVSLFSSMDELAQM